MNLSGQEIALAIWAGLGLAAGVGLLFTPAPYGRHGRRGWGPTIDSRWGWVLMEGTAALALPWLLLRSGRADATTWAFVLLWELHYVHRAFVFPLRRAGAARTAWLIIGLGIAFNLVNGYFNAAFLAGAAPRPEGWLTTPRFAAGAALFLAGMALNLDSDNRLLRLRREADGYAIPQGGAFRWVSCPNYLGEIVEWIGFAVATASPAAWVFAWWTFANLAPRARTHHRWYRDRFPEYPRERRALIPGLW